MSLQAKLERSAVKLITQTFGPSQVPDLNKPATFHFSTVAGYRNYNPSDINVNYCLLSEYEEAEYSSKRISVGDLRFYVLQSELTQIPRARNSKFTWDGNSYEVVTCIRIGSAAYEIQARLS